MGFNCGGTGLKVVTILLKAVEGVEVGERATVS
jgi:hypothetical protein